MRTAMVAALAAVGCEVPALEFVCETDPQCALDGVAGLCEPDGFCSFESDACATGRAYGPHSGPLTGACVARSVELTVALPRSGRGRVVSTPEGIDCPGTCSALFPFGTEVSLVPTADLGATFGGWTGDCSGTASCAIALDAPRSVNAKFWAGDVRTARVYGAGGDDFGGGLAWAPDGTLFSAIHHTSPSNGSEQLFGQMYQAGLHGFVVAPRQGGVELAHFRNLEGSQGNVPMQLAMTGASPVMAATFSGSVGTPLRVLDAAGRDVVVGRLTADLTNMAWVRQLGGAGDDWLIDVVAAPSGDVFVVGTYATNSGFADLPATNPEPACASGSAWSGVFVAQLAATTGATVAIASLPCAEVYDAAATAAGGLLVGGWFSPALRLVTTTRDDELSTSEGGFVVRLGPAFEGAAPARILHTDGTDRVSAVAEAPDGDVVFAGWIGAGAGLDFGYGSVPGGLRPFVARLASDLTPRASGGWARPLASAQPASAQIDHLAVDADDNVVTGGTLTGVSSEYTVTPADVPFVMQGGGSNFWLAKYAGRDGRAIWAHPFGVHYANVIAALALREDGTIGVSGTFSQELPLPPLAPLQAASLLSDVFVLEVSP